MNKENKKLISIVAPCFNEEEVILLFYNELSKVIETQCKYNFEILFINDGSTDNTKDVIVRLVEEDQRITLINFSRNFGHQNALTCGLDYAKGNAIISLDSDLQHPPSLIIELISQYENGYDIVYTIREDNEHIGWLKKLLAKLFYNFFRSVSTLRLEDNVPDYRLISDKVQKVFKNDLREYKRFLRGLISWVGFKSIAVPFSVAPRAAGITKYKFTNMLDFSNNGITSFSNFPLKIGLWLGIASTIILMVYSGYVLIQFFIYKNAISGWTSLALLMSFIGSIQFILIGVVGVYLGHTFTQVKSRPLYIVDTIINSKNR